jgi:hypothetical protein
MDMLKYRDDIMKIQSLEDGCNIGGIITESTRKQMDKKETLNG